MAKGRIKKRVAKAVDKLADRLEKDAKDIKSIKVPDAVDEAIHDDIQNGKIEAAIAASEAPKPAKKKAAPKAKAKTGDRDLKRTMQGDDVKAIQKIVGTAKIDGDFGFATLVAVKNWQTANGLTADGVIGPKTKAKMNEK